MAAERCYNCGQPATHLCDYIIAFEEVGREFFKGTLADPFQGAYPVTSLEGESFTCDRPMCEKCLTNKGAMFLCGGPGCEIVTEDFCHDHAGGNWEDNPRIRVMSRERAEMVRRAIHAGNRF